MNALRGSEQGRRRALCSLAALGLAGALPVEARAARAKVVVVGGGYAGATAAKYIRMWSRGGVDVTLVEENEAFVSCPLSNLVLGGSRTLAALTVPYDALARRHGVRRLRGRALAVDTQARTVRLADGSKLPYDRLVLAPGIDFLYERIPVLRDPAARDAFPHAWKAGAQTLALRRQLEAMADGGVFAISIPPSPYRCPPAPYERACQVASYFKRAKPRSKVLVLDANEEIQSKKALFGKAFSTFYKGMIEYQPNSLLTDVDLATRTAKFEVADDVRADVLNIIPPHGAGEIARSAGAVTANGQWCEVDFLTFESVATPAVHVLGDSIQVAPLMPKSGHMANAQAKVCAAAVVALLAGRPVNAAPVIINTCYSFFTDRDVAHIASVHRYEPSAKTFLAVQGAGGLSADINAEETPYAFAWAANIWADMLG